jgi:tetratricopeptide (TPR) repeat protein
MLALDQWARTNGSPVAPLSLRIEKLYSLGRVLLGIGQMGGAEAVTNEALILAQQSGDEKGMTNAWATLGLIAQASSKLDEAEKAFYQSALYAGHSGDTGLKYRALVHLAEIARERSELSRAAVLLEEALAIAQNNPNGWDTAMIITLLGHLARQQFNYSLAKERYRGSLNQLRSFGSPTYTAWSLEGCSALLCMEGHAAAAARLCAAAANLRKQADTPLPNNERKAHNQVIARIEDLLGSQAFQQEWAAGADYSQDKAIEFALLELV